MEINDLIRIIVEQNGDYKSMLQWAVGSIITILVIFLTANFFTMRKFRQEEIEKIKQEVISKVKEDDLKNIKAEQDLELKRIKDEQDLELKRIKDELNLEVKNLHQKEVSTLRSSINSINSKLDRSKLDFLELQGEFNLLKAGFYYNREVFNNAYTYYIEAINCFLDAGGSGYIPGALSSLEKTVEKLPYLQGSDLLDFSRISSLLDPEYEEQTKRIQNKLSVVKNL